MKSVISLSEKHKDTLGFFPYGAFIEQARRKKIIIALKKNRVVGYVLFNINQKALLVYIVHLCIDPEYRKLGVAKILIDRITNITKTLRGIRVHCRRDYSASSFWPKAGFSAIDEKPGKSIKGSTLTVWWYDYGQPSIIQYADDIRLRSKNKVVIDANVFFDIQKENQPNEEVQGLLADWIEEDIELCLTQEIYNEINRHGNKQTREITRKNIEKYYVLPVQQEKFQIAYSQLRPFFPEKLSKSSDSDLRQLSHTIASKISFFITRDEVLLKKSDMIFKEFNTRITRPATFIILHDSLIRESEYQPSKLEGTQIQHSRFTISQYESIELAFRDHQNEKKSQFINKLNRFIASPLEYDVKFIEDRGTPIALIVIDQKKKYKIRVPFFRVVKNQIGSIIAKHLAYQLILQNTSAQNTLIQISDPFLSSEEIAALTNLGFSYSNSSWIKISLSGVFSIAELNLILKNFSEKFIEHSVFFKNIINFLTISHPSENIDEYIKIEKILFPLKIRELQLPCFIVPIKPMWAMNLFDYNLAKQDLFGGDPSLLFNIENVYYRSCKPKVLGAPGRILWYVTKGDGELNGLKSINACSYINEVTIDKPKALYKKNKNLGVYKWPDVYDVANKDINKDVMSFRFDFTEQFETKIKKTEINNIWQSERQCNFYPRTPIEVSPELFYHFYKLGKGC